MVLTLPERGEAEGDRTMNETAWLIIAAVVVVIVIGAVVATTVRRRNSERLKSRFGVEYARTVEAAGDPRSAEAELRDREKRVKRLQIKPLAEADRARFSEAWRRIQTEFVDDPAGAFSRADKLVGEAMSARGYPTADFDQRSADVSVDHPEVVQNYRKGHEIALRHAEGKAGTEELRQAMVSYRAVFDELVNEGDGEPAAPAETEESRRPIAAQGR
jgi:hypothetical protein